MVPSNYLKACALFLETLIYVLTVGPTSGSLGDANILKQNKEETDPRIYKITIGTEGLSDAKQYVATTGVITRNGSLDFDSDYKESNQTAKLDFRHLLMNAKLRRMEPLVQCTEDAMTLRVKGVKTPHFLFDNGEGSLIPLSQMPSQCGFSIRRSRRDVRLIAPYQGCHDEQGGDHVLHLKLWGEPMKMSCPSEHPSPSVSCFPNGMVLNMGDIAADAVKVKASNVWEPLLPFGELCGFTVVSQSHSRGLVISTPYKVPCIKKEEDEYFLVLLVNEQELIVSCPSAPNAAQPTASDPWIPPTTAASTPTGMGLPQFPGFLLYPQFLGSPGPGYFSYPQVLGSTGYHFYPHVLGPRGYPPYPQFPGSYSYPAYLPLTGHPKFPPSATTGAPPVDPQTPEPATADIAESEELPLNPASPGSPPYPQFPESLGYPLYPQIPGFPGSPPYPQFPESLGYPLYPQIPRSPGSPPHPKFPGSNGYIVFPQFTGHPRFPPFASTGTPPEDPHMLTTQTPEPTTADPADSESAVLPLNFGSPPYPQFPGSVGSPLYPQIPGSLGSPPYSQFPGSTGYVAYAQFTGHPRFPPFASTGAPPVDPQMPTTQTPEPTTADPADPNSAELPPSPWISPYFGYPRLFPTTATTTAALSDPLNPPTADLTKPESTMYPPYPGFQDNPLYPAYPRFPKPFTPTSSVVPECFKALYKHSSDLQQGQHLVPPVRMYDVMYQNNPSPQ